MNAEAKSAELGGACARVVERLRWNGRASRREWKKKKRGRRAGEAERLLEDERERPRCFGSLSARAWWAVVWWCRKAGMGPRFFGVLCSDAVVPVDALDGMYIYC